MSRMPARKAGIATPTCEAADSTSPEILRCHTAINVPIGKAITSAITMLVTTSHALTCSRSAICGPIGAPEM